MCACECECGRVCVYVCVSLPDKRFSLPTDGNAALMCVCVCVCVCVVTIHDKRAKFMYTNVTSDKSHVTCHIRIHDKRAKLLVYECDKSRVMREL